MYTLVAVGFTLFFGVLGLINFAHGEVFMLGAFAALVVSRLLQQHRRVGGLVSGADHVPRCERVLRCGRRAVTERLAYQARPALALLVMLITSLGVSFLMREGVKEFFPEGANPLAFPSPYMAHDVHFGGVVVNYTQIALIAVSIVLVAALYVLVERTWIGKSMRATAEDTMPRA